jgi:hypothetical protein
VAVVGVSQRGRPPCAQQRAALRPIIKRARLLCRGGSSSGARSGGGDRPQKKTNAQVQRI